MNKDFCQSKELTVFPSLFSLVREGGYSFVGRCSLCYWKLFRGCWARKADVGDLKKKSIMILVGK